jgi:hypothetical protein
MATIPIYAGGHDSYRLDIGLGKGANINGRPQGSALAVDLDSFIGVLFVHPAKKLLHLWILPQLLQAVQVQSQIGVIVKGVDLTVAGRANLDCRAGVEALALGFLAWNQVMLCEAGHLSMAKFAGLQHCLKRIGRTNQ